MAQPVVGKLKQIRDNPAEEECTNMIQSRLVPPPTKCLAYTMSRQLQGQGGTKACPSASGLFHLAPVKIVVVIVPLRTGK